MIRTLSTTCIWATVILLGVAEPSAAETAPRTLEAGELDASEFRDLLSIMTDGQGHYIALVTFAKKVKGVSVGEHLFYGDGKRFYEQRRRSGSSSGNDQRFQRHIWSPRDFGNGGGSFNGDKETFTLKCGKRKTPFKALDEAAEKAMLAEARFFPPLWPRRAYVLARDDEGTYYYVDRARKPAKNFDFRLFRGPRGNMKALPLVNIVSDSEGDIFASKRGRLRLVLTEGTRQRKRQWQWIAGRKRTELIDVPVDRNVGLIYRDLGVYDGQRLGIPCDEL